MNNKQTLQNYNSRLSDNNTFLEEIIEVIEDLPTMPKITLQDKTVTPSTTTQTVTADEGYTGLGTVTVNPAEPTKYKPRYISFYNCPLGNLDNEISILDTSDITNMDSMFGYCQNITSLDITNFNTSKVTDMDYMFQFDSNLTSLDISNIDISNVTRMEGMFNYCKRLTSIDFSTLDASNVTRIGTMFNNCTMLQYLDIRSFNLVNMKSYSLAFNGVPANCEIIVKDDEQRNWLLTQRSDFTNVKTVSEL